MAGIRITDLTALSSAANGDYLCIVDVSDTSQSPEGTTKKIEVQNAKPYKSYVALLTQSGTAAPTAIVLENTLGVIPILSYNGAGIYQLSSTGLFLANKTFVIIGSSFEDPSAFNSFVQANRYSDDVINIFVGILISSAVGEDITFQPENNYLNKTPIEIRVYN